ncbi:hypothetical protein DFH06DRAFT_619964 [Mycena polygramma]|nr:hypothetical protein DFH06DRAFT_619964 [Mycena polygramma]
MGAYITCESVSSWYKSKLIKVDFRSFPVLLRSISSFTAQTGVRCMIPQLSPAFGPNKSMTIAEYQRARCETTPSLNVYRRVASLAVEVCASATPESRSKARSLAMHTVKRATALIDKGSSSPLSLNHQQRLNSLESILDRIRQHVETIPEQGAKSQKFGLAATRFLRESMHLKKELDAAYKTLIERPKKQAARGASRAECLIELASIGTRAAATICDIPAPGLALGKPAVSMVALICETVKTVRSNRTAAESLARHAQNVTHSIVDRLDTRTQGESVTELYRALQQVQDFLTILQNRRRVTSWALAVKDKDRFTELNSVLDRALQVFSASENLATTEIVRGNAQQFVTLVGTVHRVETDVQRTLTVSCATRILS